MGRDQVITQPARGGKPFTAAPARDAGVWMIRRNDARRGTSRVLEKRTKLELQMYVSGKLHELRTLPLNWDDAGGEPASQSVTHVAYRTLDRISDHRTVFPFITPGEGGSIVFEWRAGRERLEIEFFPGEMPYIRYAEPSGGARVSGYLGEEGVGVEAVRRLLSSLSLRVWVANPAWRRLFS